MIARKLGTAFSHGLTPILRIGDSLDEHRAGRSDVAVRLQLEVLLSVYHRTGGPFLVAYEPAWAISTSTDRLTGMVEPVATPDHKVGRAAASPLAPAARARRVPSGARRHPHDAEMGALEHLRDHGRVGGLNRRGRPQGAA